MTSVYETAGGTSFRLPIPVIEAISDVARGIEAGDSGLKSCTLGALAAGKAGASPTETVAIHNREIETIEDEDECFNRMGEYLAKGFGFKDVAKMVRLGSEGVHLLALERWCQRIGLSCDPGEPRPTELAGFRWKAHPPHERRTRARRALGLLRDSDGYRHYAVLHVVYGWPDPFLRTLAPEARAALGPEYGALARYTDAVEERRQELVKAEAGRWPSAYASTPALADIELRRSRLALADRIISSGDALRAATDRFETPSKAEREAFVSRVRVEANRMLTEASLAFRDAWRRV